jgi:hypothetical protein
MKLPPLLALLMLCAFPLFAQDEDESAPRTREMTVPLFNGHDFSGFTFCMKDHADPLATWSVTNGVIHCTGTPAGYLRTSQSYSNYFLTVEWRFVKIATNADNTGILVHIQPGDQVWPPCVEAQGRHGHQGDLYLLGGVESKERRGKASTAVVPMRGESVEHPVGDWNKAEVICIHGKVKSFMNSKFVNELTECSVDAGYIGIQSEGGEIEIRSLVFTPLKY